jgi:hypothetical protein
VSDEIEDPAPEPEAPGIGTPVGVVFDRLRARVQAENKGLFAILNGMQMTAREAGRITLLAQNAFSKQRLDDRRDEFERLCSEFFCERTRVEIEHVPDSVRHLSAPQREDARRLRQEALNHPMVNVALEVLDAAIVEIRPLAGNGAGRGPGAMR